jgi:hypothetical protein
MEACKWNLGIAATMLKDWRLARQCWNSFGMNYEIIDEDTAGNIGETSIRISPNACAETVWAIRICPARALIKNIPLPDSEHRFKDVVLNDGAPNGYRMSEGKEYPVLDEIQHLSSSDYQTYSIKCKLMTDASLKICNRDAGKLTSLLKIGQQVCRCSANNAVKENHTRITITTLKPPMQKVRLRSQQLRKKI